MAYGQSKTANILFASALAGRLKQKGVLAFSVEPGCALPLTYPQYVTVALVKRNADDYDWILVILETKLQTHISPEMFNDGKTIAEKAFPGKI